MASGESSESGAGDPSERAGSEHGAPADAAEPAAGGSSGRPIDSIDSLRPSREQRAAPAIGQATRHLEALFEAAPFGLAVLDADLRYERINPTLAAMNGLSPEEHVGRRVDEVLPDLSPELFDALRSVVATGQPVLEKVFTGQTPAAPGVERYWRVSYYPLREDDDERSPVTGVALAVDEISERVELETERDRLAHRARVLTDFYVAALRRHTDETEILELLARRASETVGDVVVVSLERQGHLEPVASYAVDRALRRMVETDIRGRGARSRRGRPGADSLPDRTIEVLDASPTDGALVRGAATQAVRALLVDRAVADRAVSDRGVAGFARVPLRVWGHVVGSVEVVRLGGRAQPLTHDDVALIEAFALRASLVLESARATAEREAQRRRAEVLADFLEAVTETGADEIGVLRLLAEHTARGVGDAAIVLGETPDGRWLEAASLFSADRAFGTELRDRVEGRRFGVDEAPRAFSVAGRAVDADDLGRLDGLDAGTGGGAGAAAGDEAVAAGSDAIDDLDEAADLDAIDGLDGLVGREAAAGRQILEGLDVGAVVAQPLYARGRVVGALLVVRRPTAAPYTRDEVDLVRNIGARASLALENARARADFAETAARLETILTESPVATVTLDPDLQVRSWNRAAEEMFGWREAEVVGRPLPITPPELAAEFAGIRRRVLRGGVVRGLETRRLRRDGSEVEVAVYDAPFRNAAGEPAGIVLRMVDITERKRLQAELQRTSETLRAVLDSSPLAIMATDLDRRIVYWSKAAESLYGWAAEEVLGHAPPYLMPSEADALAAQIPRVRAGESVVVDEARRRTKNGEIILVRIFGAPIRGASGQVEGMLGVHEDIRERRRLESELFEARKMESVGRLAGGIAHDFNNILTAIIGFADLALSERLEPDVRTSLSTIKASAERAAGLTQQLLAFSRRQMLQPQLLNPNDVVVHMESILRRLIGEQIELAISVTPNVGAIRVDRTQLEQVILNLALNSRDAMPDGGRLAIRTEHARFDETSLSRHFEMTPGDYVMISVTDTGTGMDDKTKAQIFEPFFTTKETGRGTGLGLATTYGIVKQSGGYIWVYSEPGRGTTFKLHFPAIAVEVVAERPMKPVSGRRSGRILLVEDEPVLRELARQVLTRHGFEVLVAGNAAEALRLAVGLEHSLDLLLSDVVMPGISGTELARRLREARPDLPVLLMSGYAEEIAGVGVADSAFLAKPFTPDTLIRSVDAALTERVRSPRGRAGRR